MMASDKREMMRGERDHMMLNLEKYNIYITSTSILRVNDRSYNET